MPNSLVLKILEIGPVVLAELRAALIAAEQPGFLVKTGDRYQLIAEDELDGAQSIAELGKPAAVAGKPLGDAYYTVVSIQEIDRGVFAPDVQDVGEARVRLRQPPARPGVIGFVVGGVVFYNCPTGPHTVMAHRAGRPPKCPQHPSQTITP